MKKFAFVLIIFLCSSGSASASLFLNWNIDLPQRISKNTELIQFKGSLSNSLLSSRSFTGDIVGYSFYLSHDEQQLDKMDVINDIDWYGTSFLIRPGELKEFPYRTYIPKEMYLPTGLYSGQLGLKVRGSTDGAPIGFEIPSVSHLFMEEFSFEVVDSLVKSPQSPKSPIVPNTPDSTNSPNLDNLFFPTVPTQPILPVSPQGPVLTAFNGQQADFPTATLPEPSTIFLFAGGLAGAISKLRRLK